jgi:hypothetical protein
VAAALWNGFFEKVDPPQNLFTGKNNLQKNCFKIMHKSCFVSVFGELVTKKFLLRKFGTWSQELFKGNCALDLFLFSLQE